VTSLSGAYSGTMAKETITGEWRQPGSNIPLVLTRYQAPAAGALKPLLGSWVGKIKANETTNLNLVFRFETAKDGKVVGFLDIPDQNAKDLPVTDIALDGGQVTFKIPVGKADYTGKLAGGAITGGFKQGGQETKLDLVRGKYTPPPVVVNIPPEARKQLLGRWSGKLGAATFTLRFEQKAEKFTVLIDIQPPAGQPGGTKDMPIPSTTLADGKLSLKIAGGAAEYSGALSGDKIDGTFIQGQNKIPLVLTKESATVKAQEPAPAKAKEPAPAPKQ
jgi:hypothetical protein